MTSKEINRPAFVAAYRGSLNSLEKSEMTFLSSIPNLLRWTSIFTVVLTFAWQDLGVCQIPAPPVPASRLAAVPASRLAAARSLLREALQEAKALRTDQERGALSNVARAQAKAGDIAE